MWLVIKRASLPYQNFSILQHCRYWTRPAIESQILALREKVVITFLIVPKLLRNKFFFVLHFLTISIKMFRGTYIYFTSHKTDFNQAVLPGYLSLFYAHLCLLLTQAENHPRLIFCCRIQFNQHLAFYQFEFLTGR